MTSYWETTTLARADYLVVGGGLVGLSTAASLLEQQPNARVVVTERGILPSGASTKNAGFACFGSASELLADLAHSTPDEVAALVARRWQGIQQLRKRLGDAAIGYENYGGYELLWEEQEDVLDALPMLNELLRPVFGKEVFHKATYHRSALGFPPERVRHLLYNPFEGQLHTGKLMQALWGYVTQRGGTVLTGTHVTDYEETEQGVRVALEAQGQQLDFTCQKMAICTNAFTAKLLPDLAAHISPGRGQVLVTTPIPNLPLKGVFHFDEGYFYFRNIEGRVLFGGGRNLDLATETTTQFGENPALLATLERYLREVILPDTPFEVAQTWSGIMAFGPDKQPICQPLSARVVLGVRLGGMGVAIGTQLGKEVAALLNATPSTNVAIL